MLLAQEQLSLSANKVLEFVCTIIRTVEVFYLSRVVTDLSLGLKTEISQWIMQINKSVVWAQTQYKITYQTHASPNALGLWKELL